jgi:hypothetical protein
MTTQHSTKAAALKEARKRRDNGETVKVFHHAGVYTQPGRGLVSYSHYLVQPA